MSCLFSSLTYNIVTSQTFCLLDDLLLCVNTWIAPLNSRSTGAEDGIVVL